MKRKPMPIALITMLVALGGAGVFYGKIYQPVSEEDQKAIAAKEQDALIPKAGESRDTPAKGQLNVSLTGTAKPPTPGPPEDNPDQPPPVPPILKANKAMFKQKPTESDLQPQWYKKKKKPQAN